MRYGSLYGPGSGHGNGIFDLVHQILSGKKEITVNHIEAVRSFIHVDDAAKVTAMALDANFNNQSFSVIGQQSFTMTQVVEIICDIVGTEKVALKQSGDNNHYVKTPFSHKPQSAACLYPSEVIDFQQGLSDIIDVVSEAYLRRPKPDLLGNSTS